MKYLKCYEGKQLGSLYHIFDLSKCEYILNTNSISSYKFTNISTTRNKSMNHYVGDSPVTLFKLELDGDKISDNYKISPFAFPSIEVGSYGSRKRIWFHENEELIKTQKIKNISKYTKKFIIIKSKIERLKDSGWFDSDGGYYNGVRLTIPEFLKKFIPKIKELFGEIYVQDGFKIIKDDEWINSIINYPIKKINHGYCLYWRGYKKDKSSKYSGMIEDNQPLNIKNKELDKLVVGWNYDDMYLSKNNDFDKLPKEREDYDLFIFDFEYDTDDIIDDDENDVHIKTGYLSNIDIKLKKKFD